MTEIESIDVRYVDVDWLTTEANCAQSTVGLRTMVDNGAM